MITHLGAQRAWHLTGQGYSYAFALSEGGEHLKHLYWGPPITDADVAALAEEPADWWDRNADAQDVRAVPGAYWRTFDSAPRAFTEEFVVQAGLRFDEPALALTGGSEEWVPLLLFTTHTVMPAPDGSDILTIEMADKDLAVDLLLHYRVDASSPALVRRCTVVNNSSSALQVFRALSASWPLAPGRDYSIRHFFGHWAGEFQVEDRPLSHDRTSVGSRTGNTGHHGSPWVAVHADAGEDGGDVWSVGLEYSGSWLVTVEHSADGGVHILAGVAEEDTPGIVAAGDRLETPDSVGLFSSDGFGGSSRAWHGHARKKLATRVGPALPVLYNSWFATGMNVTLPGLMEQATRAADLGVEIFVVDDGWFAGREGERVGLGDWVPDPDAFPEGLAELGEAVRDLGMELGIWMEPEMCTPDSRVFSERPEWLHGISEKFMQTHRGQHVIDLSSAEAREWVVDRVSTVIEESGARYMVWDMNRPIPIVKRGSGHQSHSDGLTRAIGELRRRFPEVTLQACSAGGGRSEVGLLSQMPMIWISDNTDAWDRVRLIDAAAHVLPIGSIVNWVTDEASRNPRSDRLQQTSDYDARFRAAMLGALGISADLTKWTEDELASGRRHIDDYKQMRNLIAHGEFFRLPVSGEARGFGFVRPDRMSGGAVVVAGRRSFDERNLRVRLRGLEPDVRYRVDGIGERSGRLLMHQGFVLDGSAASSWLARFAAADHAEAEG